MISRHRRVAALAVMCTAVLLLPVACGGEQSASSATPDVTLTALDGSEPLAVGELTGPAVINLWATWCGPCREELPAFQQVSDELAGRVRFIGVNDGDDGEKAGAFLDEIGVTFEQYLDVDGLLSEELRITGLPATILVDEGGDIAASHAGALDAEDLRGLIEEELGVSR